MGQSNYLSDKDINSYKEKLRKEHSEISTWMLEARREISNENRSVSDEIDIACSHEIYLAAKREILRKSRRLIDIENALRNMNDFGFCSDCGIEIGIARLNFDATFSRCVDCSSVQSIIDKNYAKKL